MSKNDSPDAVALRFCGITKRELARDKAAEDCPDDEPYWARTFDVSYDDVLKLVQRERRRAARIVDRSWVMWALDDLVATARLDELVVLILGCTPTRQRRTG